MSTSINMAALGITPENPKGSPKTIDLKVDPAANKAFETADLLAKRVVAGAPTSDGKISMGTSGDEIFGIVIAISDDTVSTNSQSVPNFASLQISTDVAQVAYNTATASSPALGNRVVADGTGKVIKAASVASIASNATTASVAAGKIVEKNWRVIDLDTANSYATIVLA